MADAKEMALARQVFRTVCNAIDSREWAYKKDEEKLAVYFRVNGNSLPVQFIFLVDADRQLVRLLSPLSFKMSEEKRVEGAVATCAANVVIADGCYGYDLSNGQIYFRMAASFEESLIGEGLIQRMIECTITMVDHFSAQFLAINKGLMNIDDFIKKTYE